MHRGHPALPRRSRLPRGRDAGDAADRRRRDGAAVRHAPQRARHGPVPAHRAGAVPEAALGRRDGQGVRGRAQLPERGDLDAAQPRVHDARVLPGVRGLPRPDGDDRGDARVRRRTGRRPPRRCRSASTRFRSRAPFRRDLAARPRGCRPRRSGSASRSPATSCATPEHGRGHRRARWASRRPAPGPESWRWRSSSALRGGPRAADLRLRFPDGGVAAVEAEARRSRTRWNASSCTSAASRWPTASAN